MLLALLCACASAPTVDLSGYLQTRKDIGCPLDLARLFRTQADGGEQFWVPLGETLSARLFAAEGGELYECRVLLLKLGADGKALPCGAAERNAFCGECAAVLRAFCGLSAQDAETLLRALQAYDAQAYEQAGTLTAQTGSFAVSLVSHPLETVLSVRNVRLRELPSAVVPESRPLPDLSAVRRETVPHK